MSTQMAFFFHLDNDEMKFFICVALSTCSQNKHQTKINVSNFLLSISFRTLIKYSLLFNFSFLSHFYDEHLCLTVCLSYENSGAI